MIAPRCICGRGRMKIRRTTTTICDANGVEEFSHCSWQGFCPECGALTPYQASINDAINAFKAIDYDWYDDEEDKDYDWYNDEGWGYDD